MSKEFVDGLGDTQDVVWHDLDVKQLGSWWGLLLLVCTSAAVVLLAVACFCLWGKAGKKKKHNFGIKKNYFKDKVAVKSRNPPPVHNPDKGSHYLKKSPSPTGNKSPPGTSPAEEYLQRKALLTTCPQQSASSASSHPDLQPVVENETRRISIGSAADDGHLGTLHCTVRYSFDKNALIVTVNKCANLPAKDTTNKSSDPYVKLQLLPEKQHKVKTRVMRRTLNPVYDEDFTFYGIHYNQLPALTLHFVVLSFDRYSRDDVIGEVMVELENMDLSASDHNPVPVAREITPRSYKLKTQGRGEVLISLCYQPAANRITVVVLKARNLPKMDITGLSDPYVKIYLLYNDQRIAKKKTHVKKRTLNPVFNESFVFELPHLEEGLKNISLEFLLLDWDRVTKNEVIGRLVLGGDHCTGTALHHWDEVISSPRRQIAEWHKLQE